MSITFTITATNDITSFNEVDLAPNLSTTLTINSITDTERPDDSIANDSFIFDWYIVDKPESSSAAIVLAPNDTHKSSITFNSIDTWGTYRIFVTARNVNTDIYSETNLFVAPESHFINLSVTSTNNNLEKPAATQRDWNTIYNRLTEVVDNTTKSINQIKVASDKTFTLPVIYGTDGQVLTTAGDGNLSWQDSSGGSSLTGLTSSISNGVGALTIDNSYNFLRSGTDIESGPNIGSAEKSFGTIYAENLDATSSLLLGDILYASTDGAANTYLKTNGFGSTSFSTISYAEISGVPDISSFIELDSLSVTQLAAAGDGSLSYNNATGVLTYTPPDLSNLGGGGGTIVGDKIEEGDTSIEAIDSGVDGQIVFKTNNQSRWSFNQDGHLIPSTNSQYDIGSAEKKVRHLFLSDNTLNIGDATLSIGTNSLVPNTNSNKSLNLNVASISLKNYNFNVSQIEPESIVAGVIYRIVNPGTVDLRPVGALVNEAGHIFLSTEDGTGLTNDSITTLNQNNSTDSSYIYLQKNDIDSSKIDLKYSDGAMSKNVVAVNASFAPDNSVITYNSGSWESSSVHSLTRKTWHATYSDGWSKDLKLDFTPNSQNGGGKYIARPGSSYYIFSFKNNTGSSLVIKKISLTCNEMYSDNIKWSASFATNNEFLQNISETLPAMSAVISMNRQNDSILDNGSVGVGLSEWNDDTFNQNNQSELQPDYFLLISINDMSEIHSDYINKRFTATVYYE